MARITPTLTLYRTKIKFSTSQIQATTTGRSKSDSKTKIERHSASETSENFRMGEHTTKSQARNEFAQFIPRTRGIFRL